VLAFAAAGVGADLSNAGTIVAAFGAVGAMIGFVVLFVVATIAHEKISAGERLNSLERLALRLVRSPFN